MYLIIAYRMGDLNGYHFPVGVYDTADDAANAVREHHVDRGGKYQHRVFSMKPNQMYDGSEADVIIDTCL